MACWIYFNFDELRMAIISTANITSRQMGVFRNSIAESDASVLCASLMFGYSSVFWSKEICLATMMNLEKYKLLESIWQIVKYCLSCTLNIMRFSVLGWALEHYRKLSLQIKVFSYQLTSFGHPRYCANDWHTLFSKACHPNKMLLNRFFCSCF